MTLVVRAATDKEYDAAGAVCVAAYRADGQLPPVTAPGTFDYSMTLIDVAGRSAHADILVAVDDDETLLGCVTFAHPGSRYAELAQPDAAEFRMLGVAPEAQRRGVATALVQACIDLARSTGYQALVICVRDFNDAAKKLYARFGFIRVPELDFVPVPGVNLEALRLELSSPR
jgi:ribosomal protein S18 acetylase RimI-like enzyme